MEQVVIGQPDPEIVALEEEIRAAQLAADTAVLDRLIAEELLFTGPDGNVGTKHTRLGSRERPGMESRGRPRQRSASLIGALVVKSDIRCHFWIKCG